MRAAVVAGVVSGLPSTLAAVRAQRDPWSATRAAGRMLLPDETRLRPLVIAAGAVHASFSLGWASVIAASLPRDAGRSRAAIQGAVLGAAIAALDLGVARAVRHPRLAAVARLEVAPQALDHLAFGAVAGLMLGGRAHSKTG